MTVLERLTTEPQPEFLSTMIARACPPEGADDAPMVGWDRKGNSHYKNGEFTRN
jgi:hypothetical protein